MDDGLPKIEVFPNHFEASVPFDDQLQIQNSTANECSPSPSRPKWTTRKAMNAASLLKFISLPRFRWASSNNFDDKVEMSIAEVQFLKSEISNTEERETFLKAQLEHVDEVLRSARLAGYLYLRTRWTELPGEPPIIDDTDVDDWLPRFVVLHGSCIFYYFRSTDLSPLDTTLLSDVVDVGFLPSFTREDRQTHYAFFILTRHGLKFECSSLQKVQVDSWLAELTIDCNLGNDTALRISSKS